MSDFCRIYVALFLRWQAVKYRVAVGIELSQQASLNKQSYRYMAHKKSLWNSSPNPCPHPRLICTSKYSFHMPAKNLVGHHHSLNQPGICLVMPTRRLAEQHGFTSVTRCVVQGVPGTPSEHQFFYACLTWARNAFSERVS